MTETLTKFVSQKIRRIRWQPTSKQVIQQSDVFATGSWDNGCENSVGIWSVRSPQSVYGASELGGLGSVPEGEPQLLCEANHSGHVTDMQFVTAEQIIVTSSTGAVTLYRYHPRSQTLSSHHSWQGLHRHTAAACPCTGVATRGDDTVVTVGEDGRVVVLNLDQRTPVRVIENADSCSIHAVAFLKQNEAATVNSIGQLKVWDMRQSNNEPARILHLAGERVPLHCLDKHPTQPHIVATGGQEGTLCIWDMRHDKFPVTLLSAHQADMWEVKFHPSAPDNLFTCSDDGSVWHWDGSSMNTSSASMNISSASNKGVSQQSFTMTGLTPGAKHHSSTTSPWLASEAAKHRLEVTDLLPGNSMSVNSIDIAANILLCGTDGEQIYTVRNLSIR